MLKLELRRAETPAEQKLREWAEAQAGGPEFARIHGALHGVIATSAEETDVERSVLRLLHLEAPDEIHALAVQAARELQALMAESEGEGESESDLITVPQMTEEAVFTEWSAGLGAVALSDPEPFQAVLSAHADELAQEERKKRRGGRSAGEGTVLREMTEDIIFLMCMTPDEYLPADFPPQARAKFAELRGEYLGQAWETADRENVVLSALSSVYSAWIAYWMLPRLTVQALLDGDDWEDDEPFKPVHRQSRKIRPNEPCPCGSGKKYKKCHGAAGAAPLF